jgi:hypothetical protein
MISLFLIFFIYITSHLMDINDFLNSWDIFLLMILVLELIRIMWPKFGIVPILLKSYLSLILILNKKWLLIYCRLFKGIRIYHLCLSNNRILNNLCLKKIKELDLGKLKKNYNNTLISTIEVSSQVICHVYKSQVVPETSETPNPHLSNPSLTLP